jgi:cysteine-rich repeat protein
MEALMTRSLLTSLFLSCCFFAAGCPDKGGECAPDDPECVPAICGDGQRTGSEQCDDGNTANGDGCSAECTTEIPETCGNGRVEESEREQCDTAGETATCDGDCTIPVCGDAWHNAVVEGCDDGNTVGGDGCSAECTIEIPSACGDGVVQTQLGEQCDDHNTMNGDGCSSTCQLENANACGIRAIGCGMPAQNGNTASTAATTRFNGYSCLVDTVKSGPEVVYEWVADRSGQVSVWMEGLQNGQALDVVVTEVGPDCGIAACVAAGAAGATFTAVSGRRYMVIVDSDPGMTGAYLLGMSCQ